MRRATWKWSDLLANYTGVVISMLKYVGTGSEVTREIWEMKLLTLFPRLELGSSDTFGKNAYHVIWKPRFARVRATCCFWRWMQSLFSTLLQLGVRSQSLCGPWFTIFSSFPCNWCSVVVSANPWNDWHFVLWVTATQLLFVFFENMYLSAGVLFPVVFLVLARVLANFSVRRVDSGAFWGILGCVHYRFPSLVILQCSEFLVNLVCLLV